MGGIEAGSDNSSVQAVTRANIPGTTARGDWTLVLFGAQCCKEGEGLGGSCPYTCICLFVSICLSLRVCVVSMPLREAHQC